MNRSIVRDIETRSTVDLADVGVHIYAAHPTTEITVVGYAVDNENVQVWHPGDPVPKAFFTAANGAKWDYVAHNAAFEMAIERCILGPRYGFPVIAVEKNVCTMSQLLALALPGKLENAAKVLNLENQKDLAGKRLMQQLSKPRRPRKDEDMNGVYYFDDIERMQRNDAYCIDDVETAREIYQRLPHLSENERKIWLLDQRINDRGFYLDHKLAQAARKIAAAAHPRINAELTKLTGGEVEAYTQVARLTKWVNQFIKLKTLNKKILEELLDQELPENVRRALVLRLLGAQAAVAKVDALLQRRGPDGRVRGAFVYHAAGPGRWSSRGAQVHNLKRPLTEDIEQAVKIIGTGDFERACKEYDNPLSVIGDCVRAMIIASPGHILIGADFSGIEARVTAWIAGEEKKLDVFRAYDAGTGPDPYIVAAAIIFDLDPVQLAADYAAGKPQAREYRQIGKGSELAFGFQGGVNAYLRFLPQGGAMLTDSESFHRRDHGPDRGFAISTETVNSVSIEEIERIKDAWRRAHPRIVKFWHNVDNAAWKAAYNPNSVMSVGNSIQFECSEGPFMYLTLPSGRQITYPQARITRAYKIKGRIVEHRNGPPLLVFKDAATGQWRDVNVYGGLLTENIVQGIARDLLAEAMLRVDKAGLKIITHVHDEVVIEVPLGQAKRIEPVFTALMSQLPEWAEGLPIKVNTWVNNRYTK